MTCAACGFENPDTEEICFRCGRPLSLDEIQTEPDRLRNGPSNAWREQAERHLNLTRGRSRPFLTTHWRLQASFVGLLSIVPGLGQLALGARRRAGITFLIYLASFGLAMLTSPPPLWHSRALLSWLGTPQWLPLTVQITAMVDAYNLERRRHCSSRRPPFWELMLVVAITSVLVQALPIVPLGWRDSLRLLELNAGVEANRLQRRDLVEIWQGRDIQPRAGDIVLYRPNYPNMARQHVEGDMLATVVAGPGSTVNLEDGHVWVDGQQRETPAWTRFTPTPAAQSLTVGPDQYFAFCPVPILTVSTLQQMIIHRSDIRGVAVSIVGPPQRRQRIR